MVGWGLFFLVLVVIADRSQWSLCCFHQLENYWGCIRKGVWAGCWTVAGSILPVVASKIAVGGQQLVAVAAPLVGLASSACTDSLYVLESGSIHSVSARGP